MQTEFKNTTVTEVKKEMLKALSTGQKTLDHLVTLPMFKEVPARTIAIALEELVFERMVNKNFDETYSIAR